MKYIDMFMTSDQRDSTLVQAYMDVKENMKSLGVDFNEDEELIFSNHILCLIKRMKSKEYVEIEDSIMTDVSEESYEIARKGIKDLCELYEASIPKSELFLVASHIQINHNRKVGSNYE